MVFLIQIITLLSMLIVNCLIHGLINRDNLNHYLEKASIKDWVVNFKTILIWSTGSGLVFYLSKYNIASVKFSNNFSVLEH